VCWRQLGLRLLQFDFCPSRDRGRRGQTVVACLLLLQRLMTRHTSRDQGGGASSPPLPTAAAATLEARRCCSNHDCPLVGNPRLNPPQIERDTGGLCTTTSTCWFLSLSKIWLESRLFCLSYCVTFASLIVIPFCLSVCLSVIPRPTAYHD